MTLHNCARMTHSRMQTSAMQKISLPLPLHFHHPINERGKMGGKSLFFNNKTPVCGSKSSLVHDMSRPIAPVTGCHFLLIVTVHNSETALVIAI